MLQFFKFAFVGAMGTVLHYSILVFMVSWLRQDPALGAAIGATSGAALNYWLNKRYTFRSVDRHREAIPRFFAMAALGIFLSALGVKLLTLQGINYLISQMVVTIMILIVNYFMSKLWIFKRST